MTAKEIKKLVDKAFKKFGEYAYFDRGVNEVMDIKPISTYLQSQDPEIVKSILLEIIKEDNDNRYETFVTSILISFEHMSDEWFDAIVANKDLCNLY